MKILIIEDEIPAAEKLKKMLTSIDAGIEVLDVCRSIEASVKWLKDNSAPSLILMDIELADGISFEIFEQVSIISPVIFITAYDKFAIKALKLHAIDYLLKPVNKAILAEAIKNVRQVAVENISPAPLFLEIKKLIANLSEGKKPQKLAINTRDGITFIELGNIIRLEADSNYTNIFLSGGKKIIVPKTLKEYEDLLCEDGFFRVHNAHIINLSFIEKYVKGDGGFINMKDGSSIEVSQLKKKELLTALMAK
jgi:two-component system, LytTR family, response regulator